VRRHLHVRSTRDEVRDDTVEIEEDSVAVSRNRSHASRMFDGTTKGATRTAAEPRSPRRREVPKAR
jgi:hypothetical protein